MLQRLHILGVSLPCPYLAQSHCCFGRMSSPKLQTLNPSIDAAGLVILFRYNQLETEPQPPHPPPPHPQRRAMLSFLLLLGTFPSKALSARDASMQLLQQKMVLRGPAEIFLLEKAEPLDWLHFPKLRGT